MALVVWGRRSRMVARPAFEPRWQRLRRGRGLHRIGHRGAIARNVAASLLTATLASGGGWQATQHLTWNGVASMLPHSNSVTSWVAAWAAPSEVAVRPGVALLDRADPSVSTTSTVARYVEPATDYLSPLETSPTRLTTTALTSAAAQDVSVTAPPAAAVAPATLAPATQSAPTVQALPASQAPPAPVAARSLPSSHVVASGETLSEIAAQYDTTVADIVKLNKLGDPNKLAVGDRLQIPR